MDYYEDLRRNYENFSEQSLKKMQKEMKDKYKGRGNKEGANMMSNMN